VIPPFLQTLLARRLEEFSSPALAGEDLSSYLHSVILIMKSMRKRVVLDPELWQRAGHFEADALETLAQQLSLWARQLRVAAQLKRRLHSEARRVLN
jgi:hypothetical protein